MIGYKVVTDDYKSAIVWGFPHELEYEIGNTTKSIPGTMGVFFFRDLNAAMDFAGSHWNRILKVNASADARQVDYVHDYKNLRNCYDHNYYPNVESPHGSWVADHITVIEEVNWRTDHDRL